MHSISLVVEIQLVLRLRSPSEMSYEGRFMRHSHGSKTTDKKFVFPS